MKIYTEEQVITFAIKVLSDYEINGTFYNREKLKEQLDATPIELPSSEEIMKASQTYAAFPLAEMGFYEGVKWVQNKLIKTDKL